jgi:hypothetical protein
MMITIAMLTRSPDRLLHFKFTETDATWDAGLVLTEEPPSTPKPVVTGTPPNWFIPSVPYVGPIRSGRLTYNQIGRMFPNSCLVYASAAWDIGERLDACEIVYGADMTTPNSALLPVSRLRELAEENLNPRQPVNYSGNLFSHTVPKAANPPTRSMSTITCTTSPRGRMTPFQRPTCVSRTMQTGKASSTPPPTG